MGNQRGAALVEFVVIAGLFITLMFAVLELGRVSHVQLVLGAAAREGARRAAVDGGESARVLDGIRQQLVWGGVEPDGVDIEISPRWAAYGSTIRVTLSHTYQFVTAPMVAVVPAGLGLQSTVYTRSERLEGR